MQNDAAYLRLLDITKRFGAFTALDKLSFGADRGEFISILGPSGCGKTTLLRLIAGLETQSEGRVEIQGRDVSKLPVSARNVGIVFQSYALFPNLNARDNIAYGLVGRGLDKNRIRQRVDELLDLVGLRGMGRQFPAQLSGGQQQRVALARAMALSPDLLLLDEPLSALDAKVRVMLRGEIRQLQQRLGVTTIMVTHDQEEALTMADRILVINQGRLVQNGTPREIYDRPATPFVAAFIGAMNFIENAVKVENGCYRIGSHHLSISGENGSRNLASGAVATLAIRPEDVMIRVDELEMPNILASRVEQMEYRGANFRLRLNIGPNQRPLEAEVPAEKVRRLNISPSMPLAIQLPHDRLRVYASAKHRCNDGSLCENTL
jgi:iron(III) transport system ATP-binding protein